MAMNPVVHFEMPAEDKERMKKFYSETFGWHMNQLGQEMGGYVTVQTSETEANGFPKKPGMINGGFYQKTPETQNDGPSLVIAVEDIHAHMEKVKAAGGTILGEPMDIPGVGPYVSFIDPEGNRVSMLQPLPMG